MCILGIDLGNFATKVSNGINFESKCTKVAGVLQKNGFVLDGKTYYMEDGTHDTEYRKINKQTNRIMLGYALARSAVDKATVVVGLPISQYQQDKDTFKEQLLSKKVFDTEYGEIHKRIVVEDLEVYPEGVSSVIGTSFQGVVIDIGGRTTDCCQVTGSEVKKVVNPLSIPKGILNLHSDFIKALNARYGLDLKIDDAQRILDNGLKIKGEVVPTDFAIDSFKAFVEDLVAQLNIEYSLSTLDVKLVGGGSQTLLKPLVKRIPNATIINEPFMANAKGFQRVGEKLWA